MVRPRRCPLRDLLPAAACCLLLAAAAACSSAPPGGADRDLAHALRSHGADPATVLVPWQLNAEMREWVHHQVPKGLAIEDRLTRLLKALLGSDGLALQYQASVTSTAAEAFATRRANCLGFTGLFVGMAREIGVQAFYLEVGDVEKFEREGNLVVESGHITAGYGAGKLLRILEFTPVESPNYRSLHRISDLTAVALFYSNRGAELLKSGRYQEALVWLRQSTQIDPGLARAWINLGVALRRTGDAPAAEAAYRRALEDDPTAAAAYQNLAALLYAGGRSHEGDALMALSSKLDSRNPFNYLALGDVALVNGRIDEARGFYRRAERLEGASTDAMAALGEAALAAGDRREARRWLRKAAARDARNDRVMKLTTHLADPAYGGPQPAPLAAGSAGGAGRGGDGGLSERAILTPPGPPPQERTLMAPFGPPPPHAVVQRR
jgi:tetratricopeptide (TPR) repeat protein